MLTIRQAGDEIVFLVCDGFDPALVEGLPAEGAFIEEENSNVRKKKHGDRRRKEQQGADIASSSSCSLETEHD